MRPSANVPSQQTIEVLIDGKAVGVITPKNTSYEPYSTDSFTITSAGNHTLTFAGTDPLGGDNTAFIDAVAIVAGQPNQPFDAGFESAGQGSGGTAYQYDPTGSPWTFSGYAGVAGNASAFTTGNPNAPQGSQVAFIQMTGSLSQSFNLAAGIYDVNLLAAQRGDWPFESDNSGAHRWAARQQHHAQWHELRFVHQRQLCHRRRRQSHADLIGPRSIGRR